MFFNFNNYRGISFPKKKKKKKEIDKKNKKNKKNNNNKKNICIAITRISLSILMRGH